MENTVSIKPVKSSIAKPNGKPTTGHKTLGIETDIHLYKIEEGDNNEEGGESEILVIHESSLVSSNKNLVKRNLP